MDWRDQELLDRQMGHMSPTPRNDRLLPAVLVAVFFAGVALGGLVFGYLAEPMGVASDEATTTASLLKPAPPIAPR
jgi:predicted MFS family arabinose efflux permease